MSNERPVVGRYEPVVLAGTEGTTRVAAKVDTGSDRSTVDETVIEEIGSTQFNGNVKTRSGGTVQKREVVSVSATLETVEDSTRVVEADVDDRSHYTGDFLIGADLLEELGVLVDPGLDNCENTDLL